jgi:SAM-dependent methyltransferase
MFTTAIALWLVAVFAGPAAAQLGDDQFQPQSGQPGKDVVWVPTPYELVEAMMDMANVGPTDFVMDLGSGDGRNIIAAAKRGARAVGVEYNPEMVALSRRLAAAQGVADKATFVEGDMFEADISKASVLALFLLPDNLRRLRSKFLDLKPGSRIVANTFGIENWEPDETKKITGTCATWCTAMLWIVPAKVDGRWRLDQGELALTQDAQKVSGTLSEGGGPATIENARLRGEQITFTVNGAEYTGRVNGDTIQGTVKGGGAWRATRIRS